jgi:integrase
LLTADELQSWRDGLGESVKASTANRLSNCLRAALNLAADRDARIHSRRAWEVGLESIRGAQRARNVVLTADEIRRLVEEARTISPEFGLFIEVAAVTGARTGQLAKLTPSDVRLDHKQPRLMMPKSSKGKGPKAIGHTPVPIPHNLAVRLQEVGRKAASDVLLVRPSGKSWGECTHTKWFYRAAQAAKLNPKKATAYALRHSSITRQLLAGVPVRVVAALHDTSVGQIEKNYSSAIADFSDALARPTLPDFGTPAPSAKVTVLRP